MVFVGFNVNKIWRVKVEGRRKRGRGWEEIFLKFFEFKFEILNVDYCFYLKDYLFM